MIVTIFMSTMESLSAILHVKYRFNVFSIYGRYTHNYSVSFCNFKLTIIFVNAVEIYHISWMFTISLVLHIYTVYYIIIHIPTLRNGWCLHHLFVVGIVEPRLCPKWNLSLHLLQNINHQKFISSAAVIGSLIQGLIIVDSTFYATTVLISDNLTFWHQTARI